MAKVFFLGATGHIGGEVLDATLSQFPDIEVIALVRTEDKGARLRKRYRNVKTVIGDLDSLDVIEQASKDVSIVINTAPDVTHAPTTHAIARGLATATTASSPHQPTYLIHTSGAAITWTLPANGTATDSPVWTDLDPARLLSAPPTALHVTEDGAVRAAATAAAASPPPGVNVAIVSPTVVYGLSRSSEDHAVPVTLPTMVAAMERLGGGSGFAIGEGKNRLGWVHVQDLAEIYVGLVRDALEGLKGHVDEVVGGSGEGKEKKGKSEPSTWGPEAYYFAADEEMGWREWMELLAPEVGRHVGGGGDGGREGFREAEFEQVVKAIAGDGEPTAYDELQAVLFGTEMRCRSDRARKLLGWVPRGKGGVKAAVGETVDALFAARH